MGAHMSTHRSYMRTPPSANKVQEQNKVEMIQKEKMSESEEVCSFNKSQGEDIQSTVGEEMKRSDAEHPTSIAGETDKYIGQALVMFEEGNVHFKECDFVKAKACYEKALRMLELSSHVDEKAHTAVALSNLGLLEFANGRIAEAKTLHEQALAMRRSISSDSLMNMSDIPNTLEHLALDLNRDLGFHKSDVAKRTLISKIKEHDSVDAMVADSLNNLGGCLEVTGDLNGAKQMYEEAIELRKVLFGEDHVLTAESMMNLATVLSAQGFLKQGANILQTVYQIYEKHYGKESVELAIVQNNCGVVLTHMEHLEQAHDLLDKAYQTRLKFYGPDHYLTINSQQNLQYNDNKMQSMANHSVKLSTTEQLFKGESSGVISDDGYPFCK